MKEPIYFKNHIAAYMVEITEHTTIAHINAIMKEVWASGKITKEEYESATPNPRRTPFEDNGEIVCYVTTEDFYPKNA